jgi:hypothetical protein
LYVHPPPCPCQLKRELAVVRDRTSVTTKDLIKWTEENMPVRATAVQCTVSGAVKHFIFKHFHSSLLMFYSQDDYLVRRMPGSRVANLANTIPTKSYCGLV